MRIFSKSEQSVRIIVFQSNRLDFDQTEETKLQPVYLAKTDLTLIRFHQSRMDLNFSSVHLSTAIQFFLCSLTKTKLDSGGGGGGALDAEALHARLNASAWRAIIFLGMQHTAAVHVTLIYPIYNFRGSNSILPLSRTPYSSHSKILPCLYSSSYSSPIIG